MRKGCTTYQPCPVEVDVWLFGCIIRRPQCEIKIDRLISIGAKQAPSS